MSQTQAAADASSAARTFPPGGTAGNGRVACGANRGTGVAASLSRPRQGGESGPCQLPRLRDHAG
jgi:hypothetical protein